MGSTWLHVRCAEYVLNVLVGMGRYRQRGARTVMTAVTTNSYTKYFLLTAIFTRLECAAIGFRSLG
jgi:hypothetical protein